MKLAQYSGYLLMFIWTLVIGQFYIRYDFTKHCTAAGGTVAMINDHGRTCITSYQEIKVK